MIEDGEVVEITREEDTASSVYLSI
jgi:hypothetical protein